MSKKFIGEFKVNIADTPYSLYVAHDWALEYTMRYGQIDGDHHKAWVLDQIARILNGTPVIVTEAKWDNGHTEYRFTTGKPSKAYIEWVKECKGKYDKKSDTYEYGYYEGIPP